MSIQGFNDGPLTYKAAADIAANLLVTLTSTAGSVDLCGEDGFPVGVSTDAVATGAYGTFQPLRGRILVTAGDTISAGDFLTAGGAGVVIPEDNVTARSAMTVGQAETAASLAGTLWMVCLL